MEVLGFSLLFISVKRGEYVTGKNFVWHELLTNNEGNEIWIQSCTHGNTAGYGYLDACCARSWTGMLFADLGNPFGGLQTAAPGFRISGGVGEANPRTLLLVLRLFSRCTFLGCSELWQGLNQGRYLWETAEQHLSPSVRSSLQ